MTSDFRQDPLAPCSDAHCILAEQPREGQHTNGGCQHLKERGPALTILMMEMGSTIVRLQKQLALYEWANK